MYAVIDIETTGGNVHSDRITEIAVVLHDGKTVEAEFGSLVHPEQRIPFRITEITGITNEMVTSAPKFYEVARQIVELTEGRTIVAHNARFDYGFLRKEFKSLGFDFKRDVLCTVELSRQMVPGLRSYALGRLVDSLELSLKPKHRAMADAQATAALFSYLNTLRFKSQLPAAEPLTRGRMNPEANLHRDKIDQLPQSAGVYYFYNEWRQLIYIGKSVNIRSRVLSHFNNNTTARALEMKTLIDHIRYSMTGSELIALLKESEEIKQHKPIFNRAQRKSRFQFGLFSSVDAYGYISFRTERLRRNGLEPVTVFSSATEAKGFLEHMVDEYQLCQTKCGLHRLGGVCFHYNIKKCLGACCGEEGPESYNLRARNLMERVQYRQPNFMVLDRGREESELSVVLVENGKYMGYGFVEKEFAESPPEVLRACIQPYMDTKDVRQIINLYLRQEKPMKVLVF